MGLIARLTAKMRKGRAAEAAAAEFLRQEGFKVIELNYRGSGGEVDIIASEGETLVFTEVKARKSEAFGGARSAVGRAKQERITVTALEYIKAKNISPAAIRFDVIAITDGRPPELIRNAFTPRRFSY